MSKNNAGINNKVTILGANFYGLISACYLAKEGYDVEIYEPAKDVYLANNIIKNQDFKFELCANWYFLPEITKNFWSDFDKKSKDIYDIKKLNPGYKVFFKNQEFEISDLADTKLLFSKLEPGSGVELEKLLRQSSILHKNYVLNHGQQPRNIKKLYNHIAAWLYRRHMNKQINNLDITKTLKIIPSLVYGSLYKLPAESLAFNFADFGRGNYYPTNGYEAVIDETLLLAKSLNVKLCFNKNIQKIKIKDNLVQSVRVGKKQVESNYVISYLTNQKTVEMLPNKFKNDWLEADTKSLKHKQTKLLKFAFGLDCKVENLEHHNIFYDSDWTDYDKSFKKIYNPKVPPFFVDCPSKTDKTVCNEQNEILIVSVYLPPNIENPDFEIGQLKAAIIKRISEKVLFDIEKHIIDEYFYDKVFNNDIYLSSNVNQAKIHNLYYLNPQTNPETNFAQAVNQAQALVKKL